MIREKARPMPPSPDLQGMRQLKRALEYHVHAGLHLTSRTVDVFQAVRQAAAAGVRAISHIRNFANGAGYPPLAIREFGYPRVEVFGGQSHVATKVM
ncbi:MAG: DUF6282 family protein [Anaerolineales bacterium]|nr:DUF6282 family protein [Anaerolineales bacterium]